MTVTDTWKYLKKQNEGYSSITEFSDIMAKEMLEYAKTCKAAPVQSDTDTVSAVTTTALRFLP